MMTVHEDVLLAARLATIAYIQGRRQGAHECAIHISMFLSIETST
jgi:hypothetical protein